MRSFLSFAIDLFWAGFAIALIGGAALVTAARLALPEVSSQRDVVASWISETVGRPALIGDIEASWSGWAPRVSVNGIAFLDPDTQAELVRFEYATINIAPLNSLLARALKPKSLVLSGVELTLVRDNDGRFSVAGMPPPKSPILKWLIGQDNFAVTDADLTIIDQRADQSFALSGLTLTIRNRNETKLMTGFVDLPTAIGRRLVVEFSSTGDPLSSAWSGEVNFRIDDARSDYLVDKLDWQGAPPPATAIDLTAWSHWQDGRLASLRFALDAHSVDAGATALLTATGRVKRRAQGWKIEVIDFDLPQRARGGARGRFSAAWDGTGPELNVAVRGRDLPLGPLAILAAGLAPLEPAWREALQPMRPSGVITDIEGAWLNRADRAAHYYADMGIAQLSSNRHGELPGVTGLEARLTVDAAAAVVSFEGTNFKLDDDVRLLETLDVTGLSGRLALLRSSAGEVLRMSRLRADVGGTRVRLDGRVHDPFAPQAHIDMALGFATTEARRLHHLVPTGRLPERGETWLRRVIEAGSVSNGSVVVRGALRDFPYRDAQGVFRAGFDVENATLSYSTRWPQARALTGRVDIDGPAVRMRVDEARVLDADIVTADIIMADLFATQRFVHIRGTARGPGNSAAAIVMASPMRRGKAARLADLDIDGDIEVDLDIDIGLFSKGPRDVLGQAHFAANRIEASKEGIVLDDLSGDVSFTRGEWYGEGLSATFEGMPVGLVVNGGLDDPNYDSEFRMTGVSPAATVIAQLGKRAASVHRWLEQRQALTRLSGRLPWKAVLTIPTVVPGATPAPRRLVLESSLEGFAIDLPAPLDKTRGERRPLRLEFALRDGLTTATRIDFGSILDAEIDARRRADGSTENERLEILFGSLDPRFAKTPGISLSGYLARLSADDWGGYILPDGEANAARSSPSAVQFDLQVSALELFGNQFEDMRVHGRRGEQYWDLEVDSTDSRGRIRAPHDVAGGTLSLDFERLHLKKSALDGGTPATPRTLDPRRLPAVDFGAGSFSYGDIALGRAAIKTSRRADGLAFEELSFTDADFNLRAAGEWLVSDGVHTSHFNIDLGSDSLANILTRFGYNVANIDGGETRMSIDASWPGTPVQFTLARLAGSFELHVNDGRFLDIEPGGGRLFGLLSLQSLPRRLLFDFDDLFRKGFAFDNIDGVFELENGNAYTNSLLMTGPSARIDITGRIGLAEQDYDQQVVVTPALSDSIPVAGALFGPIGVGAGAVYYIGQKMFKSIPESIDRFLSRHYTITGSWQDPSIERL